VKLCNEREQIKRLISDFLGEPPWRPHLQWNDAAAQKAHVSIIRQNQERARTEILALDPEIATVEQIKQIETSTGYRIGTVEPKDCEECWTNTWDIVDVGLFDEYGKGAYLCGNCLEAALRLVRSSRARRNESRKALAAIAALGQESDDYGDDYGETTRE